jgi:hypothetical protein
MIFENSRYFLKNKSKWVPLNNLSKSRNYGYDKTVSGGDAVTLRESAEPTLNQQFWKYPWIISRNPGIMDTIKLCLGAMQRLYENPLNQPSTSSSGRALSSKTVLLFKTSRYIQYTLFACL